MLTNLSRNEADVSQFPAIYRARWAIETNLETNF
jgi:hypothetical protein